MNAKQSDVEAYLANLPAEARTALAHLRQTILAAAPDIVETFSYRMPAYRYRGRSLVWIGAAKDHCAMYGMSSVLAAHSGELTDYRVSKGTLRFSPLAPLPDALVQNLVRARVDEIGTAATVD